MGSQSKTEKNGENSKSNESAAIFVQVLEVSSISRFCFVFSKSQQLTKSDHMVWRPRLNGRAVRMILRKIVGCHRMRKATPGSGRTRNSLSFVPWPPTYAAQSQASRETQRKSGPSKSEAILRNSWNFQVFPTVGRC